MSVYVVRHVKAGSRRKWEGPDDLRPLSEAGRRQAEAIADWLAGAGRLRRPGAEEAEPARPTNGAANITRIVSSPMVRCRQTVEPLAERLLLPVDLSDALIEGAPLEESWRLLEKFSDEQAVLCTHGDVMGNLLFHAQRLGVRIDDDRLEKGSTWIFDFEAGAVVAARYVPPPK